MSIRKPVFSITEIETGVEAPKKEDKRELPKVFVTRKQANGFYTIQLTAGGEVPNMLKGFYTTGVKAEQAARAFVLNDRAPDAS